MPNADLQRANLDLLLQLDRLLAEADRARSLRDHLLNVARHGMRPPAPQDAPTGEGRHPAALAAAGEGAR